MAEHYQVLARKWRPQRFEQVVGQTAVTRTLANALDKGRIAHAYCFSGIRGVGKTTLARLFAKGLSCRASEAPTSVPCGECEACREIEESRNLDVVEMDAASQTGVDDIRQLNEFARYTPSRDRYRVFIIDEAHMLSTAAFNALLKTLEEPPAHVVFMLATTEPHKIPQTVLSRCQHYPLSRISQAEIVGRLREIADAEGVEISDDSLALLATAADGSLRDAQSLLDKIIAFAGDEVTDDTVVDLLGLVDRELLSRVTELIGNGELTGVLRLVNELVEQGVDLHQFTLDLIGHFRNLLVARTVEDAGDILHLPEAELAELERQAGLFELEDLDRAFALLSGAEYRIKQSELPRYQLEMALSRLARLPRLEPIANLISELRDPGSGAPPPVEGAGDPRSARGGARGPGGAVTAPREGPPRSPPTAPSARPPSAPSVRPPEAPSVRPPEAETVRPPETETLPPAAASPAHPGIAADSPESRILSRLQQNKPLIARIVRRADQISLRDDRLWISFPANGGIFRERLRDRSALEAIEAAAESAVGRPIRVMASFADDGPASAGAAEATGTTRAPQRAPAPPPAPEPTARSRAADARRTELWKRVEEDPLVSDFIEALQGHLTEVEEA